MVSGMQSETLQTLWDNARDRTQSFINDLSAARYEEAGGRVRKTLENICNFVALTRGCHLRDPSDPRSPSDHFQNVCREQPKKGLSAIEREVVRRFITVWSGSNKFHHDGPERRSELRIRLDVEELRVAYVRLVEWFFLEYAVSQGFPAWTPLWPAADSQETRVGFRTARRKRLLVWAVAALIGLPTVFVAVVAIVSGNQVSQLVGMTSHGSAGEEKQQRIVEPVHSVGPLPSAESEPVAAPVQAAKATVPVPVAPPKQEPSAGAVMASGDGQASEPIPAKAGDQVASADPDVEAARVALVRWVNSFGRDAEEYFRTFAPIMDCYYTKKAYDSSKIRISRLDKVSDPNKRRAIVEIRLAWKRGADVAFLLSDQTVTPSGEPVGPSGQRGFLLRKVGSNWLIVGEVGPDKNACLDGIYEAGWKGPVLDMSMPK